jgi:hypothetical protein
VKRRFIPPLPSLLLLVLVTASACATAKRKPPVVTYPFEPGSGACRASIEAPGSTGLVRYVVGPEETREIWDTDGDGNPEREVRKVRDTHGRVVKTEEFDASGTVIQRIEREWDDDHLLAERGDRWGTDGTPGPDGKPDWSRQLEWKQGRLVAEYLDETNAEGLPGIDGDPEFVTKWTWKGSHRVAGEKRHDGMIVAALQREFDSDKLAVEKVDWGADGKVDEETRYEYDGQGRVHRLEHRARGAGFATTYAYDCEE